MNWLSILQTVVQWAPTVKSLLDTAKNNEGIAKQIAVVASPIVGILADFGSQMFGEVRPDMQPVAAAMAIFDANIVKWVQMGLNDIDDAKLEVDGIYGPKTKAAVSAFQTKHGLVVDGWAGRVTQSLIDSLLSGRKA